MASAEDVHVQVAYARPDVQIVVDMVVAAGSTVEQVIRASGMLLRFPQIDLDAAQVGIHGELVRLADEVSAGDRIEIYRPLKLDPTEARRWRAAAASDDP